MSERLAFGVSVVALVTVAGLFAGRRDFMSGVSCVLWIVVSALYVVRYRIERKNEGRDR